MADNNLRRNDESKRPRDIAFLQQKLPTYYPVINAGCVFPLFFILSAIFIPLGVGIYYYAEGIFELTISYSDCKSVNHENQTCEQILDGVADRRTHHGMMQTTYTNYSNMDHKNVIVTQESSECNCRIDFTLKEPIQGTVYIYYALTNFYQNHLKYYRNRDEHQFKGGKLVELDKNDKMIPVSPSGSCTPEEYRFEYSDGIKRPILPCGIQANSMFFDGIKLSHWYNGSDHFVALNRTDIAWESDKKKFNNPPRMRNPKDAFWSLFGKPPSWKKNIWELDTNKSNNGFENEDFIIWMKTAAFPNFRKLHRIVNGRYEMYKDGLPAGQYSWLIEYHMLISKYNATKFIILTNSREVAAKNYFLAYAFGITGIILFLLFILFLAVHLYTKNRPIIHAKPD